MGIGLGVVLLVIGLILVSGVINFDFEYIDDAGLGWIFVVVGALAIVLALVVNARRNRHTTRVERHHVEE